MQSKGVGERQQNCRPLRLLTSFETFEKRLLKKKSLAWGKRPERLQKWHRGNDFGVVQGLNSIFNFLNCFAVSSEERKRRRRLRGLGRWNKGGDLRRRSLLGRGKVLGLSQGRSSLIVFEGRLFFALKIT